MATANGTTDTITENDMPEVFVRTPAPIGNETCDKCGIAVRASYSATSAKTGMILYYCAHHIREYEAGLKAQEFVIFPEDTSFLAGGEAKRQGL